MSPLQCTTVHNTCHGAGLQARFAKAECFSFIPVNPCKKSQARHSVLLARRMLRSFVLETLPSEVTVRLYSGQPWRLWRVVSQYKWPKVCGHLSHPLSSIRFAHSLRRRRHSAHNYEVCFSVRLCFRDWRSTRCCSVEYPTPDQHSVCTYPIV